MAENLLAVHPWHWVAFGALVALLLIMDLLVFHRRVHTPTFRESVGWSVFWIGLALAFNAFIWWWGKQTHGDSEAGLRFLTGFLVEKSLSVDNLFVFAVIFRFFRVELKYQYRVLFWGVLGAIFMRLAFILAGVGLLELFEWSLLVFGAFLIYTGIRLGMPEGAEVHPENNIVLRVARRWLPMTKHYHGERFFVYEDGRWCLTPLVMVLLVIESSDVLFAVDSVPAIIGITKDPFIVFTSNIFAILGLRALYFLLAGIIDRFRYLHYGLSAVLVFIGVKMCGEYGLKYWLGREAFGLPAWLSLVVIGSILAISIGVSMIATRRENRALEQASQDDDLPAGQ